MVTFKTGGSAPYVDEGWYEATLGNIEERESQSQQFPGVQVVWHFGLANDNNEQVFDDRGMPLDFWVFTSQSVGPKSNARPIIEALLSRPITREDDGDELAEIVIGKSCQVKIADYYKEDGEFGGSKPVKGSWLPLGAPRPGARAGTKPPARQPVAAGAPKDEVPF